MRKLLPIILAFILAVPVVNAQSFAVKGSVTGVNDTDPLPGVSVVIKGTQRGTTTGSDGTFQIEVPNAETVLVFSFVGYQSVEETVGSRSDISVKLVSESKSLEEMVVVGYGTQSKRAVTGAVISINYDKFKDRSFSNVTQSLAGTLPGVNISQSQGAPGASPVIKIRGVSSITAGTNPLIVVDGVPLENFNLNLINPQDIESIEVLKDASSAAIYGSRGSSGVILVTTKMGKPGKVSVSANVEYGSQKVVRRVKMMDAQQYIETYVDAKNNAWTAQGGNASDPNSARPATLKIPEDFTNNPQQFGKGTNWQDVMFRTAPSYNAQITISGGTEKTQYMFSAAYLDQTAVLDANYYKRLSVRSNVKTQISKKLSVGLNLGITSIFDRTEGTQGKSDVISLGLQSNPHFPVYNENGNLGFRDPNSTWFRFTSYADMNLWHPYSLTREVDKSRKSFNTLATGFLEYEIVDNLRFRTSLSGNLYNMRNAFYWNDKQKYGYSAVLAAQGNSGDAYMFNWLSENTLTYEKKIGEHALTGLLGYTSQKQRDETMYVAANNFPNDLVHTLNAGTVTAGNTTASEWSLLSYLARVQYNFKNKYFLTGAIRRDGMSRFGEDNKWGYFPSVSAGWLISDESFLSGVNAINSLKLRASYGVTGNNQIPNYGAISLLAAAPYVNGTTIANGLKVSNLANSGLRWEKTNQFNVGVDLAIFNNRVNLSAEYYNSITRDMLLFVPVPDITGFSSQLTNIGKMRNRGVELNISSKNLVGDFTWTTDFNLSRNRNKVLQLGPGNAPIQYVDNVVTVRTEVGQPVSNFYGYVFDGVFNNQNEIDAYPHHASTTPGDPKVRDVNGDGKISDADRTILGNYQPDFTAGITNTVGYKGFELSFLFQGSFGGEIANNNVRYLGTWDNGRNFFASMYNYWRSEAEPGDGKHFKPSVNYLGLQKQFSSYWVEDASFVRLRNVRVSYALPAKWSNKLKIGSARVYVNAENVHLFSKYTGYDPENTTYGTTSYSSSMETAGSYSSGNAPVPGAFQGVDYGSYPLPRVITVGIKADF
ncbi:SusC/RagA family TonB-linked outer membrane protein [Dyadobacter fanqingshengii]|uniref:TonB-dependent receptor n=1 Tax=Dyadobacter fanqingshengii TaxID=2906443 RepID=A0A9X1P864_9BACT|nr:TonB-dependent receptor [Dyadobacter fanqingshengii]MCF0040531.1 TonB-dependent receptor [Dyadobacter fanqingshengii]USJ37728.1 TonB-dependent receptor [Dyadobacter fanqingshengii]